MLTIDRFEGALALCEQEDGAMISIPRIQLAPECAEGDAVRLENGIYIPVDNQPRREEMRRRMQSLFQKK